MFRFESLDIWKLATQYAKSCYTIAGTFPNHEKFSLADQLRRAAISISNNIAEGSVDSPAVFKKYLSIAIGSTLETVNILNFSCEIGYISLEEKQEMYRKAEELIPKIRAFSRMLHAKP